jgi:hypothetical protein
VVAARVGREHANVLVGRWFHQGATLRREERRTSPPQDIEEELERTKEEIAKSSAWDGKWGFDEVL